MIGTHDDSRRKRLGAALRENLKRRKQQLRGRAAGEGPEEAAPAGGDEGDGSAACEKRDG
jgi:hypothetical protein